MSNFATNIRSRAADLRKTIQSLACSSLRFAGRETLSREETLSLILQNDPGFSVGEISVLDAPTNGEILKWGVVRVDGRKCLDLDYGSRSAMAGWSGSKVEAGNAAALWSHPWMGYYHWIIDIAPKISLLQAKFGRDLGGWKLCYPRQDTDYERETLEMLGIPRSAVIDTRKFRAVRADRIALSVLPGWYEIQPSAELLRSTLIGQAAKQSTRRIYLSRKGRRRCTNEEEVFGILAKRGFTFIEDTQRSMAEQIGLFQNAEVIVSPHGAALTNLLWCESGATVIELFGESYQPPYYQNLSAFRSLNYHTVGSNEASEGHWSQVDADLTVDTSALVSLLDGLQIS